MGNCLFTKLKSEVQNENLPYFNKIVLNITPGLSDWSYYIRLRKDYGSEEFHCKIEGDGTFLSWNGGTSLGKEITMKPGAEYYSECFISKGTYKLIIDNSYKIDYLEGVVPTFYDITKLSYNNVVRLTMPEQGANDSIDTPYIDNWKSSLLEFDISNSTKHSCVISDLVAYYTNINKLIFSNTTKVTGDATIFADSNVLPQLQYLTLTGSDGITNRTAATKTAIEAAHPGITVNI